MTDGWRVETIERVRWLTIDRPERKNALTQQMRVDLTEMLATVDDDDDVDVVVLAAVDPVFCAGVDIKEVGDLGPNLQPTDPGAALRAVTKPVLCSVNGACVSGGLEIALSCDWIVASERARFADTHARLGALPRWGLSAMLPRAVGVAKAKEMTLTGNFVGADEALRLGLVTQVWPHDELGERTAALAADIVTGDQRANQASLELYDAGSGASLADALLLEAERARTYTVDTDDFASRRRSVTSRGSAQQDS